MCAIIRAKPGQEDRLRLELVKVVKATQAEPGCRMFHIHEIADSPGQFMLWEVFASRQSLREHVEAAYTQAYFAVAQSLMSQPTEVIKLDRLA
jgi:quinol monooxygenase YgiN